MEKNREVLRGTFSNLVVRRFRERSVAMDFIKDTFILSPAEYAKVYSEINTNYGRYKGKRFAVHASYGVDDKAYWYYFENLGFDNYNIYMRIEM